MKDLHVNAVYFQVVCSHCKKFSFRFTEDMVNHYLQGTVMKCGDTACDEVIDLWKCVVDHVSGKDNADAFSLLDGLVGVVKYEGPPGQVQYVAMDNANKMKLIYWRFTNVTKGIRAAQLPTKKPNHMVFGFMKQEGGPEFGRANIQLFFVPDLADDFVHEMMINAVKAFVEDRYDDMVIDAHLIVEIPVNETSKRVLDKIVGGDNTNFLKDVLTTSRQLKRFIPVICELVKFPQMPKELKRPLEMLTYARNDLSHAGKISNKKSAKMKEDFAQCLAAAFITNIYFRALNKKIDEWMTPWRYSDHGESKQISPTIQDLLRELTPDQWATVRAMKEEQERRLQN